MSLKQYLALMWARRWLVLAVTLLCGALGTAWSLRQPKQYAAESQLVLDVRPDPVLGGFASAVGMTTQLEILKSDKVALRVAETLLADPSPQMVDRLSLFATSGKPLTQRGLATALQAGMTPEAVRGSNIIAITAQAPDGPLSMAVANAFAQAAIDTSVQLRVEPTRESAQWLTGQTRTLRADLEQAQARLSQLQQASGLIVSDERMTQESARLNALEAELVQAESQRLDTLGKRPGALDEYAPEVQQHPAVTLLRQRLSTAEARLADLSATLGSGHPRRIQAEAEVAELRQQAAAETRRVMQGASASSRVSGQKVAELRTMVEAQKQQVLSLRAQRDRIAMLQHDVDSAQRAYDSVSQRAGQLSLESQNTQTSVRLLTAAADWADRSQRKMILKILVGFVAGLGLGAGIAVLLGLRDWRVRIADDLRMGHAVPLIGVLRAPGGGDGTPSFRGLPLDGPVVRAGRSMPAIGVQP